ncbi:putative cysteine-rich receptor-like protein kinase 35 [Carya illinoinensis]|uniref:putative cysteine-rich receptor-like protein kinase 35 n=1 Tax=Carya illinoinensis TaxID=32201 RepID=UPI001C71CBAF|nr:putative cysteine-rich receptor-like protein kinase 35 [Carya illinoinensis]
MGQLKLLQRTFLLKTSLEKEDLVQFISHSNFLSIGMSCPSIYGFSKSISLHEYADPIKRAQLNWEVRDNIIQGIAGGLLYLHQDSRLRIIHRDLKASNILLDADMNPKISDFGTARLFEADQSQANTHKIVGTYGYMPPEYTIRRHFSVKSDVFSFGVLFLEIVRGMEKLEDNLADRPNMSSVVLMLNSQSTTLPVPTRPAFLMYRNNDRSDKVHGSNSAQPSINKASISEPNPR